jgi:hypothetical protein
MNTKAVQFSITIAAAFLVLGHIAWPDLAIDKIAVSLLLIAIVPWLPPLLRKLKLPGGFEVEFQDVQRKVGHLELDIRGLRVALSGTLTKHEIKILKGLADGDFPLAHYAPEFFNEIKRLDAMGFIQPTKDAGGRLETIRERFGDERIPVAERARFRLSEYVEMTPSGKEFINLYKKTEDDAQQIAPADRS